MKCLCITLTASICIGGCMDSMMVAPKISSLGNVNNVLQLEQGRNIYITSCSRCHNALRITKFTQHQWNELLPEMIEESNLGSSDSVAVEVYIKQVLHAAAASTQTNNRE